MKIGRNARCPCGTGRKYKQCCEPLDREVGLLFRVTNQDIGEALGLEALREALLAEAWQADVVGGSGPGEPVEAGAAGMVAILGGGHILCLEALERAPAEPSRAAALLERALRVAELSVGASPPGLAVRSETVAAYLRDAAGLAGVPVTASAELPELDAFAQGAVEQLADGESAPAPALAHDTWREWGWPAGVVAELFRAAEAFWRAAPWRLLDNLQLLSVRLPSGSGWTACILGNGGMQFGLALYRDMDDVLRQAGARGPGEAMAAIEGPVLSLTYGPAAQLERRAVKEILAAGWEVAGPEAYPELVALNPPADGVSSQWAAELTAVLWAVPRFVHQHIGSLASGFEPAEPLSWADPQTGVELSYNGHTDSYQSLWPPPESLAPALPAGPSADPEAALADGDPDELYRRDDAVVRRFGERLARDGVPAGDAERHVRAASWLIEGLNWHQGIPLAACTELDLRVVLYDWFPRKAGATEAEVREVLASLEHFFAYAAEHEGLAFPWAEAIVRDGESFQERFTTCPGGAWWSEELAGWMAEVYDDLEGRGLLPDLEMAGGEEWGATMGVAEAALRRELERRWLLWRDEVIASGICAPDVAWEALVARQRAWETGAHPGHKGRSPAEVILAERTRSAPRPPRRRGR